MSGEELWQIGVALSKACHINLAGYGPIVTLAAVIDILNSHSPDAQLRDTGESLTLTPLKGQDGLSH